jgi:Family of unknown function (DUF6232)
MEEKIFFNEGGVTVSNSRFVVGGQTYAMSEITSIQSVKVDQSKTGPFFLLFFSIYFSYKVRTNPDIIYRHPLAASIFFYVPLIIGLAWLFRLKPKYKIIWNTSSGRTLAYARKDKKFIETVVTAVNDARAHPINHESTNI